MHVTLFLALLSLSQDLPDRPPEGQFLVDGARMIGEPEAAAIRLLCAEALSKRKVPILVVTVEKLPEFAGRPEPIEWTARTLFSKWGIGWEEWNYGILVLVSKVDRKARIELGGAWAHRKDGECEQIMRELILPDFKKGDFGKGLVQGVRGLHALALDLPLPRGPWMTRLLSAKGIFWSVVIVLVLAVAGDAIRGGGSTGCAPFGLGCLGGMLGSWLGRDRSWDVTDNLFRGGGSFGGGSGGGGGASGSW